MLTDLETFVMDKRRARVPVAHIASMAGRPIDTVRRVIEVQDDLARALAEALEPEPEIEPEPIRQRLPDGYVAPQTRMEICAMGVAEEYGLTVEDLRGNGKKQRVVAARNCLMWRLINETKLTLNQIGRYLGGRHHTTILYGSMRHAAYLSKGV